MQQPCLEMQIAHFDARMYVCTYISDDDEAENQPFRSTYTTSDRTNPSAASKDRALPPGAGHHRKVVNSLPLDKQMAQHSSRSTKRAKCYTLDASLNTRRLGYGERLGDSRTI